MLDYELIDAIDALIGTQNDRVEIKAYNVELAKQYCKQLNKDFKIKHPIKSERPLVGVWKEGDKIEVRFWKDRK
jgi:hypothetical protein